MSNFEILLLAYALSIDALLVSFSYGLVYKNEWLKNAIKLALFTGIFQGIMPVIGYFTANLVKYSLENYASYIAGLIFVLLGLKIILEKNDSSQPTKLCIDTKCLFFAGIATSIDALAAGFTLSLQNVQILFPIITITFVTILNSLFGFYIGNRFKKLPEKLLNVIGGLILIFLGVKTFLG